EACHGLGVPHVTLDLREEFRRAVVAPFVRGYARGGTPNPCTRCNGGSRIVERDGRLLLARGADPAKDQSYMLASLDPRQLARISFPLGGQGKQATRAEAERAGLAAAGRAESQEACFLAGDDYRAFLERRGLRSERGPVVDGQGRELGAHPGYWRFTPGQRRGLGLGGGEPLSALRTVPATNTVLVGPRTSLTTTTVDVAGRLYVPVRRAEAKVRYRSPAIGGDVAATGRGFRVELDEPAYGVAPGQTAVLYEGEAVVGCGVVST